MSNHRRAFSLKKPSPAERIYMNIKFPLPKGNFSPYQVDSKLPIPSSIKLQNHHTNIKSPIFSSDKGTKGFQSISKMPFNQSQQNQPKQKLRTQTQINIPKSSRNDTQSTKDMVAFQSHQFQRESMKMKNLIRYSEKNYQRSSRVSHSSENPGPFEYHVQLDKNLTLYGTFYREKRMLTKLSNIPGVGQYSIDLKDEKKSPNTKFPLERGRQKLFSPVEGPGPGDYNCCSVQRYKADCRSTAISFSKEKRSFQLKHKLTPGPGDYEVVQKKINNSLLFSNRYYDQNSAKKQDQMSYKGNLGLNLQMQRVDKFKRRNQEQFSKTSRVNGEKAFEINPRGLTFPLDSNQIYN